MKTILNEILYKLAENELANSLVIDEQAEKMWQRIKNKFKRDKYDYSPAVTSTSTTISADGDGTERDDVNIDLYNFKLDPPLINATITSKWGKWRPGPPPRRHKGIDIATNIGTTTYAVRPGTVLDTGNQTSGWGNFVIIKHDAMITPSRTIGEPFYSLYAHLSEIGVSKGDTVDFGTVIGKTGGSKGMPGSGNSEGPHLHFEIKTARKGGSIDPNLFYKKYKQKFEHAQLHKLDKTDTETDRNIDYIVNPTDTKVVSKIDTDVSDVKSDEQFVSGKTIVGDFVTYDLPNDDVYLYGIPIPVRTDLTYGWWFVNSIEDEPSWRLLKSKLTPANYSIAVEKLNSLYPDAIDQNRLAVAELPQQKRDTTTTTSRRNQTSTNEPVVKPKPIYTKTIFNNLVLNHTYTFDSVLKRNTNNLYKAYQYKNKKFIHIADIQLDTATDQIKYLGHDSANEYMLIQVIVNKADPGNKNKYWISVKDIDLKK